MLDIASWKILVAGNCIFRRGVASIVRDVVPSASIVEAVGFADARARLNRDGFFAAIFDLDTDELNGPVSFRTLRVDCPDLILGVMSRTANAGDILGYMAAGVTGFILETSGHVEVQRAVRDILDGAIYIPPDVIAPTECEPDVARPALRQDCRRLTPRQNGVLGLLLKGYSNKEIARELDLSPHTVKIHVSALLRCFAVQKRSSLALAACSLRGGAIGHCGPLALQISA
jgi:DNA-binding NarL/FixJ family response regulator